MIFSGLVNQEQQQVIEFQRMHIEVLLEIQGKKRILLNDDQRARMAVKGKILGQKMLKKFSEIFTPDTILRWHRMLVAQKWDYSERRQPVGHPRVKRDVADLIVRMAKNNPDIHLQIQKESIQNQWNSLFNSVHSGLIREY